MEAPIRPFKQLRMTRYHSAKSPATSPPNHLPQVRQTTRHKSAKPPVELLGYVWWCTFGVAITAT